ncbi:hypothetical protein EYF80_065758 [Liparis tanakae]|uniref:Uncharacterized protein n=1 Tax=Liparis tanakae TaxID=230148 RepID=A0A4Z2E5T2_9TELE|nr:hypothetical protein EYF80_065758 [Liparis tanakae]
MARGAPTVAAAAAAALTPERCPGLPSPMQNLTAPGGPGNSNVTCSCNCTASQPQGMEICEYQDQCVAFGCSWPGKRTYRGTLGVIRWMCTRQCGRRHTESS